MSNARSWDKVNRNSTYAAKLKGDLFSVGTCKDPNPERLWVNVRIELPVQFRDIDRMGHVNHAVYLQYMETARVELARRVEMIRDMSSSNFIVAMAHVEYKKPIRDEPRVSVTCWVSRIGDRSWDLDYTVTSGRVEFAIGRTTQVGYNYETRSTVRISEKLRKALGKYSGKPLRFREA